MRYKGSAALHAFAGGIEVTACSSSTAGGVGLAERDAVIPPTETDSSGVAHAVPGTGVTTVRRIRSGV